MKLVTASNTKAGTTRIYLDDVDITDVCFYAEAPEAPYMNGEGVVKLFAKDKHGVITRVEVKTGLVRWEPIP